jgi:hypothetical protein
MIGAVSDAQLFEDLFRVVLSWELPELFVVSWCTVTSISYIHTCIQNKAIHVCVCVVSVFFFFLAWQSEKKKRMDLLLSCQFFWIHSTLKGVCHPIIVSRVPTCRHCFPQLNTRENATGFIQTWPATHSLLFCLFYFILFCFLPKKKNVCVTLTLDLAPNDTAGTKTKQKTCRFY